MTPSVMYKQCELFVALQKGKMGSVKLQNVNCDSGVATQQTIAAAMAP